LIDTPPTLASNMHCYEPRFARTPESYMTGQLISHEIRAVYKCFINYLDYLTQDSGSYQTASTVCSVHLREIVFRLSNGLVDHRSSFGYAGRKCVHHTVVVNAEEEWD